MCRRVGSGSGAPTTRATDSWLPTAHAPGAGIGGGQALQSHQSKWARRSCLDDANDPVLLPLGDLSFPRPGEHASGVRCRVQGRENGGGVAHLVAHSIELARASRRQEPALQGQRAWAVWDSNPGPWERLLIEITDCAVWCRCIRPKRHPEPSAVTCSPTGPPLAVGAAQQLPPTPLWFPANYKVHDATSCLTLRRTSATAYAIEMQIKAGAPTDIPSPCG
jgi:hypothetical protein